MLIFLSRCTLSLFLQLTRLQKNIEQIKLHLSSRSLLIQQPATRPATLFLVQSFGNSIASFIASTVVFFCIHEK